MLEKYQASYEEFEWKFWENLRTSYGQCTVLLGNYRKYFAETPKKIVNSCNFYKY